jgi:hypothetical protein
MSGLSLVYHGGYELHLDYYWSDMICRLCQGFDRAMIFAWEDMLLSSSSRVDGAALSQSSTPYSPDYNI